MKWVAYGAPEQYFQVPSITQPPSGAGAAAHGAAAGAGPACGSARHVGAA
jgi:hypothetical protein